MIQPTDNLDNMSPQELLREQIRILRRLDERIRLQQVETRKHEYQAVVIVDDFNMSFGNIFGFMIKWLLASIPLAIAIGFVLFFLSAMLSAFGLSALNTLR